MTSRDLSHVLIGAITSPLGLKGEVKIRTFTFDPMTLFTFPSVVTEDNTPVALTFVRLYHLQTVVARIAGVSDRTQADMWKGVALYTSKENLPVLDDDDTFYVNDLIGLKVLTENSEVLGHITAVENFGASDIIEFYNETMQKKQMVPFIPDAVLKVEAEQGFVMINIDFAI